MTKNDDEFCFNQNPSHNMKVALLAIMQMRTAQKNLAHIERLCANQDEMVNFNAQQPHRPANFNREMTNIIKQIYVYQMMQKSEEFRITYLKSPTHLK
jgi:hypothetical protein